MIIHSDCQICQSELSKTLMPEAVFSKAILYTVCAVLIICIFCADFYLLRIARQFQRRTCSLNEANHHLQRKLRREHNYLRRYNSEGLNAPSSSSGFIPTSLSRITHHLFNSNNCT